MISNPTPDHFYISWRKVAVYGLAMQFLVILALGLWITLLKHHMALALDQMSNGHYGYARDYLLNEFKEP